MVVICMSSAALAAEDPVVEESDRYILLIYNLNCYNEKIEQT